MQSSVDPPATRAAGLPAVDRVLGWAPIEALIASHGRALVVEAVRDRLAATRNRLLAGDMPDVSEAALTAGIDRYIGRLTAPSLRPVLNLTGTVLHTNLGRAPLAEEAIAAMVAIARGASTLEYDIAKGRRGDRDDHVEEWLCRLTGAEAATVVNNNAAAVMLVLAALATRREVPVSRGELIEIGGAFRLPDIMARAGCRLVEVGTTNRTHLKDFEAAIGPKTALLLKAHTSNYVVEGFTAEVPIADLVALAHRHELPVVDDLGAGTLVDLERWGLPHETTPAERIAAGVDVVTFSGDKLLGGPQAGIIAGKKALIQHIRKHPMKRAMRCDKVTLAALEATLKLYADPNRLPERLPSLRLLTRAEADIRATAEHLVEPLREALGNRYDVEVRAVRSQIGSGALPVDLLPSAAVAITGRGLKKLAERFRNLPLPVIGRVQDDALIFDLRCLERPEDLAGQLCHLAA